MEPLAARQILQRLVEGADPASGAALPAGTPLADPTVIAALEAALASLAGEAERARRRAQLPPNLGAPWSETEEQALCGAFRAGTALGDIARAHRRTLAAIEARLERLGLLLPQQRVTRNRYVTKAPPPPAAGAAP